MATHFIFELQLLCSAADIFNHLMNNQGLTEAK